MLTKVEITNVRGDVLSLPLFDFSGGYQVKNIEGLDPVKASLTSSSMAQVDGAQPQASRRDIRNVTARIEFKPNYSDNTVESLRKALYAYLMPKSVIKLDFYIDGVYYAWTNGTVETFENSRFAQIPEMNTSIICYDPDFCAPSDVTVTGSTVADTTTQTITYGGSTDTGIIFTLNVNRTITGFTLHNNKPDGTTQSFDIDVPLVSGDVVTITTIPRQKSAIKTVSGTPTSVLYGVQPSSAWINFGPGDNLFRASVSGAAIPWTLSYTPRYGAL